MPAAREARWLWGARQRRAAPRRGCPRCACGGGTPTAAVQLRPGNAAPEREGKGVGEDEEGVGKLITSSIRVEVDRSGIEAGGRWCLSYAAVEGASRARAEVEVAGRGDAAAAGAEGASVVEAGGAVRRRGGRSEAGGNARGGGWRKKGRGLNTLSLWHRVIISTGT